jgi:hypothetical protein
MREPQHQEWVADLWDPGGGGLTRRAHVTVRGGHLHASGPGGGAVLVLPTAGIAQALRVDMAVSITRREPDGAMPVVVVLADEHAADELHHRLSAAVLAGRR